jgi:hypothetical protein
MMFYGRGQFHHLRDPAAVNFFFSLDLAHVYVFYHGNAYEQRMVPPT